MRKLTYLIYGVFIASFMVGSGFAAADDGGAQNGIPNFLTVTDAIFRGGNPIDKGQEDSLKALSQLNVAVDIDLQGGDSSFFEPGESAQEIQDESVAAHSASIKFVNLPLNSHNQISSTEEASINQALSILKSASAQSRVFIHCEHGEDRTGMVIALYRVLVQKWKVQQAHDEWVADGHSALNQIATGELDKYFYLRTNGLP